MKIYLFLDNKMLSFSLPSEVSGSFSFDENINEESKLLNVEAREGKWVIYSTDDVKVGYNGNFVDNAPLLTNTYYIVSRNNKNYVVYTSDISTNITSLYTFYQNLYLSIGKREDSSLYYNCPYLGDENVIISYKDNELVLENNGTTKVYVNYLAIKNGGYNIKTGDQINIFGLNIMFLKGVLIFCCPKDSIRIGNATNLTSYLINAGVQPEDIVVKDRELYNPDSYFSKSPRIRRVIEMKEFRLSEPPGTGETEELPLLLTIGPMLMMGVSSMASVLNVMIQLTNGTTTFARSWPALITSFAMLSSMLVWPTLSRRYNKRKRKEKRKEIIKKYNEYLQEKEKELIDESKLQKDILIENLVTLDECVNMIMNKQFPFWNKRSDQSDFLVARIGKGNPPLAAKINDPERGFTLEESELQKKVNELRKKYKYIKDAPMSYSFYLNMVTAIMGERNKCYAFMNNVILQLISFYSYEDLKLVVFTDETNEVEWDYIKYLNHNFSNDRDFRFFSSTDDTSKVLLSYLENVLNQRQEAGERKPESGPYTPYYLILIDNYSRIKKYDFIRNLTELPNYGMSVVLIENRLSKLPSKCNNFITIGERTSGILQNAYERQEQTSFTDEVRYNINMMSVAKIISNIPIEFESSDGNAKLPEMVSFLEMEKVGKVEQLNILNRWRTNDSTQSLKAEVGINPQNDLIYLDLHEKEHGPHGLIAGTTGSGKSEFIITYILSMCINYSPEDVSFILIDYKGGGLAFAFENKATGKVLPHLAGTITNLDKAEMDRTLVSIDSELKRRQRMFNEARDALGESTIDIYKYQRFYHEGRINEPIPHLFIICDEFAELKSQQPDFMDSLISTARIGRSLGVHLILATQKPSGIVTDQIWSNTKFRVCLKVQDAADSKEMLKKPDAAAIKETGRFYLQVGYDELYVLGQSAWAGAKYFPSDKIVKTVDKSINFLNDCGQFIKSIQASNNQQVKGEAKGEQIINILDNIIEVSTSANTFARKLWLDNIPEIILESDIAKKYGFQKEDYNVEAVIGEYDAPEKQEQGIVIHNFLDAGNTIIYGNDSIEREMLLNALVYSSAKTYSSDELNFYAIDYGSEALRVYNKLPHFGGTVYMGEDEKYNNLFRLLTEETSRRKKLFADYNGEYKNYIKFADKKLPLIVVIINNYDSIYETNQNLFEILPNITRDSERLGIVYIMTCNGIGSVRGKVNANFKTSYAYKLKDDGDYKMLFNTKSKTVPRDINGRGVLLTDDLHEFQTVSIVEKAETLPDYLMEFVKQIESDQKAKAKLIPTVPDIVSFDVISKDISTLSSVPVGINKAELSVVKYNFLTNLGNIISANKIEYIENFVKSLLITFRYIQNLNVIIIDATKALDINKELFQNYYTDNLTKITESLVSYVNKLMNEKSNQEGVILIYGIEKYIKALDNPKVFEDLCQSVKKYEKMSIVICDTNKKIKAYTFEVWFQSIFSLSDGIWYGNGITEQGLLKYSNYSKELSLRLPKNMGYVVEEDTAVLCKLIDYSGKAGDDNDQ